jgi:hypothetical protein
LATKIALIKSIGIIYCIFVRRLIITIIFVNLLLLSKSTIKLIKVTTIVFLWSSCCTRPKKTKTNQKNPEKHPENPPEMYASQGRYILNDSGLHLHASTRTIPSNGPPQQERANTTPQSRKTSIKKASDKI